MVYIFRKIHMTVSQKYIHRLRWASFSSHLCLHIVHLKYMHFWTQGNMVCRFKEIHMTESQKYIPSSNHQLRRASFSSHLCLHYASEIHALLDSEKYNCNPERGKYGLQIQRNTYDSISEIHSRSAFDSPVSFSCAGAFYGPLHVYI